MKSRMSASSSVVFWSSDASRKRQTLLLTAVLWSVAGMCALAQDEGGPRRPDHMVPTKPFHIIGNIYYVGQIDNSTPFSDDTSYLIATSAGHIMLDTGLEQTVHQNLDNIKKLGFRVEDIKILIHSHSHSDHVGGDSVLKQTVPGLKILAMEGDADVIETGGKTEFDPQRKRFTPVQVDRIIKDGEQVRLGEAALVAHLTPGHTKGCTTWTMSVEDGGRKYNTIFLCSAMYHPGVKLVNERYPNMVKDFFKTFSILRSMNPDVFLASHGLFFGLVDKAKRLEAGATPNPFIDHQGFKAHIDECEKVLRAEMTRQGVTL